MDVQKYLNERNQLRVFANLAHYPLEDDLLLDNLWDVGEDFDLVWHDERCHCLVTNQHLRLHTILLADLSLEVEHLTSMLEDLLPEEFP